MKNPTIEVRAKRDKTAVYYKDGVYQTVTRLIDIADTNLSREFDLDHIDIYLDGEKVDKPVENGGGDA